MAVRSKTLVHIGALAAANANQVVYTCPAGVTAIAKDIRFANPYDTARRHVLSVRRAGVDAIVADAKPLAAFTVLSVTQAYIVLLPGDQLVAFIGNEVAALGARLLVSGVELDGVAP